MRQTLPIHRFFTTILFLAVTTLTWAYSLADFAVDGIYYDKNTDGTSVTVTYKTTSYNSYSGSVVIPSTVTYSGKTYNVTSIGQYAFRGSIGLKSVTIPNSVTSIGDYAFSGCSGLTSVTIPNSVTSIGNYAFEDCTGLTSVTIPNSVTSIGYYAFSGTAWYNNQPDGLVYAGKVAYKYKGTMPSGTEIVIKEGTLGIAKDAFYGCTGLKSVTIPNSVTSIDFGTFDGCSGLTSVTIPNSVTSIGSYAFYNCSGLTSVTIPESVTSIGDWAFRECSGLTSVTIPNSVTSIGYYAFSGCSRLKYVTCHAQNVPSTDSYVFYGVPQSTATLYVPKESIDAYKSASPWKDFGTILPITPTAVESLIADEVSDKAGYTAIYDLQGRRLHEKPAHGFYIQGGKKHFVK